MTSHLNRVLLAFLITVPLALAGCGGNSESATAAAAEEKPPLPADVEKLSGAAQAQPATAVPAGDDGAPKTAGELATASGDEILATGELISPVRSELASKVPGRVGRVLADEGQRVTKGQPLLELETDYLRLALERSNADLARAGAAAADASRELERKKDLFAKGSVPRAVYDRAQSASDQANAAVASAAAAASLARQQLGDSVLRAPFTGAVAERLTDVGERLGDNTVAFVLVQTSPLKLRFRVPERFLATVHKGQGVSATVDPYPGETFEGEVGVIGQVIDPGTRTFVVESVFPNRDGRLRPGLFARVEMKVR